MKKYLLIMLTCLLFMMPLACEPQDTEPQIIQLSEENSGEIIRIKLVDTIEVGLTLHGTEGYEWENQTPGDSNVVQVGEPFHDVIDGACVGGNGHAIYTFKPVDTGIGTIKMSCERPWESEDEPVDSFEVRVVVR